MTTVGYGDKTPTSVPARLFTFLWIIIGITVFSIVTATFTSEIYKANSELPPSIQDARVGTIRHHTYEGILVASNGGLLVDVDCNNITDGIDRLVQMLHTGDIDGFVIDRYELLLFWDHFGNDRNLENSVRYLKTHTVFTEISHQDELMYGVLIRAEEDYQFLSEFVQNNRDVISSCNSLFLHNYTRRSGVLNHRHSTYSMDGEIFGPHIFWPAFVCCGVLIFLFIIFGISYELKIRYVLPTNC